MGGRWGRGVYKGWGQCGFGVTKGPDRDLEAIKIDCKKLTIILKIHLHGTNFTHPNFTDFSGDDEFENFPRRGGEEGPWGLQRGPARGTA